MFCSPINWKWSKEVRIAQRCICNCASDDCVHNTATSTPYFLLQRFSYIMRLLFPDLDCFISITCSSVVCIKVPVTDHVWTWLKEEQTFALCLNTLPSITSSAQHVHRLAPGHVQNRVSGASAGDRNSGEAKGWREEFHAGAEDRRARETIADLGATAGDRSAGETKCWAEVLHAGAEGHRDGKAFRTPKGRQSLWAGMMTLLAHGWPLHFRAISICWVWEKSIYIYIQHAWKRWILSIGFFKTQCFACCKIWNWNIFFFNLKRWFLYSL